MRLVRATLGLVRLLRPPLLLSMVVSLAGAEILQAEAPGPEFAKDSFVTLPPGTTPLVDLGIFRVSWQSYGKDAVLMPPSWTGHFAPDSGISATAWGRVLGRDALLLHSPWRAPPGRTTVEYPLRLPKETPIRLSFGIAMGADVATPEKSDGVTFSCGIAVEGNARELLRVHHAKAEWVDHAFDLSEYAGKNIVLRLQVEPGPARNASWDYSFFGDARIQVGTEVEGRDELLERLTSTRAYRAVTRSTESGLLPLANRSGSGVTPSNLLPCRNSLESEGSAWRFRYEGDDCRVVYTLEPSTGTLDDLLVEVDGSRPFHPAQGGGAFVDRGGGGDGPRSALVRGGKLVSAEREGTVLYVVWESVVDGKPLRIAWRYSISGKALLVSASCDEPVIGSFSLGEVGAVPFRRVCQLPYLLGPVAYLPAQNLYACRYLDWTVSHSSSCPQGAATYDRRTDGVRNTLSESGYVAVSPDVNEVLPNIPHRPSPYRSLLAPRVMLDIWGHHDGTYRGDAENLLDLKDHGVDHLAIISHVWQRYGYDVKLPDHLPADPRYGGDEGMRAFGKAANECGYVWSLHENYIDLYPDAPSYDPEARVLLADGTPSKAWFNAGTGVQSFGLKCNRALGYAKENSPEIHRRFGTNAAYLDVHTCVPPWHQLDHEAGQPMAAMALAKVKFDAELFTFERETHGGPLFGEGSNHFFWAGQCDGVEAQVSGGEDHTPFLDFDLLKIHPQMVNHGMGYYERWFRRGYSHEWGHDTGTMEQIDKYRAQELAYGHAGFVGAAQVDNLQWVVREHHLMHPVQRLYGATRVSEIRYEVDGRWVTSSVALAVGDTGRPRIRYAGGLSLWVNLSSEPWTVDDRVLPQWGFLAKGPSTEAYTSRIDGKFCDYAECPEYVFADARTSASMPYLRGRKTIEPRLRSFEPLGGNRARITYEWVVNDELEEDYHCFVHGVPPLDSGRDEILFQQDHALAKPTSLWRRGEVVVDGPHELTVSGPLDAYDLVIGLYKGARVPLAGLAASESRVLVARLALQRVNGEVSALRAEKATRSMLPPGVLPADFSVRLNPEGTWIDFGKVATDGSVKVQRGDGRLTVFPYPRDRRFDVSLDLDALAPGATAASLRVRGLASRTQADLGPATWRLDGKRLRLTVGGPGVGRYEIGW